jgi:hypothetical protein
MSKFLRFAPKRLPKTFPIIKKFVFVKKILIGFKKMRNKAHSLASLGSDAQRPKNLSDKRDAQLKEQFAFKEFEIKLKSNTRADKIELDDNLIKIIENEYATKYLESLYIEPTLSNIRQLLTMKPLSKCQIESGGWSGSGKMAESIKVIPNPRRNQSAQVKMPGLVNSKNQVQGKVIDSYTDKFEEKYSQMKQNLAHSKSTHRGLRMVIYSISQNNREPSLVTPRRQVQRPTIQTPVLIISPAAQNCQKKFLRRRIFSTPQMTPKKRRPKPISPTTT